MRGSFVERALAGSSDTVMANQQRMDLVNLTRSIYRLFQQGFGPEFPKIDPVYTHGMGSGTAPA